jgi:hypothetical protein
MLIGNQSVFERNYTAKFITFAKQFGEIVDYENDRAARDKGLHLTRKLQNDNEAVTSAFCWFQLKGMKKSTLSKAEFLNRKDVGYDFKVNQLVFWYSQPTPTYLVLYIESVDIFLINIQKYIEQTWGNNILSFPQQTKKILIPAENFLQPEIFLEILYKEDLRLWTKFFGAGINEAWLCMEYHDLIERLATINQEKIERRLVIRDWINKFGRLQLFFEEKVTSASEEWHKFYDKWMYELSYQEIENEFVFLEFSRFDYDDWLEAEKEENCATFLELSNGEVVSGIDVNGLEEIFQYTLSIKISQRGLEMYKWISLMKKHHLFSSIAFDGVNNEFSEQIKEIKIAKDKIKIAVAPH